MPLYEYRCRTCDTRFEVRRSMSDAALPAACPDGHVDTLRLLSTFATVGGGVPGPQPATTGGGCCGGGCGCRH